MTVPVFYVASGLNKVAPVMTRVELFFIPSFNLINQASWDRLSPEQQAAIERARRRTGLAQQRREVREFQAQMSQAHVKGGGQLLELDPSQREAYRRVMEPMWPRMVAESGPNGAAFFAVMRPPFRSNHCDSDRSSSASPISSTGSWRTRSTTTVDISLL